MSAEPASNFEYIELKSPARVNSNTAAEAQPGTPTSKSGTGKSKSWFTVSPVVARDAVLGLSDGLTVPFALSAGLTAFGTTRYVILGGLAELLAGSISMGLGGYVGGKSALDSFRATERRCADLIESSPEKTAKIVKKFFLDYQVPEEAAEMISTELHKTPEPLTEFLLKNHFEETAPEDNEALYSGLTLGIGYLLGGILPLTPYFFVHKDEVNVGLYWSIGVMTIVLLVFGYVKTCAVAGWMGRANVVAGVKGGAEMLVVGTVAAGVAVGLVRAINGSNLLR